ncbi:MAG: hypothetical protein KGJ98_00565 [Chloroflexota bacterium]|nr:hypothetical protein [Chloroflexota bacterium]
MRPIARIAGLLPAAAWRLVAGLLLMIVLTFAEPAYGLLTAEGRVDPAVWQAASSQPRIDVLVVLGYKPDAFHLKHLQAVGTVGAASNTSVELRRVTRSDLDELASTAWISRIELLPPQH